jgi:isopentenyl-diphosphate delta-isomerase
MMKMVSIPGPILQEKLCLVNQNDELTGTMSKDRCHIGAGRRHRAFSLHILNSREEFLIHRRSELKMLWPGFWSNSCCSHPRAGETVDAAVKRRAIEELGISVKPLFCYKFEYREEYLDVGTEHEICHVFVARSDELPKPNSAEVSETNFVSFSDLDRLIASRPEDFTPWSLMQWDVLAGKSLGKLLSDSEPFA